MSSPAKQLNRLMEEANLLDANSPHIKPPPAKRAPLGSLLPSPMDAEKPHETPFLPTMDDLLTEFLDESRDDNPSDKENVPQSSPAPQPVFHGMTFYLVEYPGRSSVECRSMILTGGGRITKQIKAANRIIFPCGPHDQLPPGFQEIVQLALPRPCVNFQWLINSLAKGSPRPLRNYAFPPIPQLDQDEEQEQEAAVLPAHRLPTPPMRLFGTSPSPIPTKASHDSLFSGPSTVPSPSKTTLKEDGENIVDSGEEDVTLRAKAPPVEPEVDGGDDGDDDDLDMDEDEEEIPRPPSPAASEWLPNDAQSSSELSSPDVSSNQGDISKGKSANGHTTAEASKDANPDDPDSEDEWMNDTFGGRTSKQSPLKPSPFDNRRIPKSRRSTEPQNGPLTAQPRRRARTTLSESPDIPLAATRKRKTGVTGRLGQACGRPINASDNTPTAPGPQDESNGKQASSSNASGSSNSLAPSINEPSVKEPNKGATATASAPQSAADTNKNTHAMVKPSARPPQPSSKPVDPVQRVKQLVEKEKEKDDARKAAEQEAVAQKTADQEKEAAARRAADAMVTLAKRTSDESRTLDDAGSKGRDPPTKIPVPSTPTSSRTKDRPAQLRGTASQPDKGQQGVRRSWRPIVPMPPPPPVPAHTRHQSLPVEEPGMDSRPPISRRQSYDAQAPTPSSSRIPGGQSPHWSSGRVKPPPPGFKLNPQARSFAPPAVTSAPPSSYYPRQTFRNQFFTGDPHGTPLGRPPLQKRSSNGDEEVASANGLPPRPVVDSSKDPRRRPASAGAVPISRGPGAGPDASQQSPRKRLSDADERDARKRARPSLEA